MAKHVLGPTKKMAKHCGSLSTSHGYVTHQPLIDASIIIVSWNAKQHLLQCVESIERQSYAGKAEIIVVDNASCDGSPDAIRERYPSVRIVQNARNMGFAAANNIGIESSTGRFLFLINSDVVLQPDCLSRLLAYMRDHPTVGLAGPKILNSDGTLQKSIRAFPTITKGVARALALDTFPAIAHILGTGLREGRIGRGREVDILSGCFWVVRREALSDVGLLDEKFFIYAEDKDWCIRFWKSGWPVSYLPDAEATHFGGGSSANEPARFYVEEHRANLHYWKKHYGRLGQSCIFVVMILHQLVRLLAGLVMLCFSPGRRRGILFVMRRCFICVCYLLRGDEITNGGEKSVTTGH